MEFEPDSETAHRLIAGLERMLGPAVLAALADPFCEDVSLNPDGAVWKKSQNNEFECIGELSPVLAQGAIQTIASFLHQPIDSESPLLDGELPPHGHRIEAGLPPVSTGPFFTIRKSTIENLWLDDYVERGSVTEHAREVLRQSIAARRSILIIGATGSGKTTFANTLLREIVAFAPTERIIVLEGTREIKCAAANHVGLATKGKVTMADLVRRTLRMRPDRIIVGEVRGPEALDLLQAWGTGHPGIATLHAHDARRALRQLELYVSSNPLAPSDALIPTLIGLYVDVIVAITETPNGRKVREVVEVLGHGKDEYETRNL